MNRLISTLIVFAAVLCSTSATAQCNDADLVIMCEDADAVNAVVVNCGTDCIFDGDPEACFYSCMTAGVPAMTDGCVTCFSGQASCATSNCLVTCAFGSAADCEACINANCSASFFSCAGIEDSDGDGESNVCDCDDNNTAVYPDAPGTAEGLDNNCDGVISADEELAEVACEGDLNGDMMVTVADILLMLGEFGCVSSCQHDLNDDGMVTVTDILILLGSFGVIC
jgi:hypothetical protein